MKRLICALAMSVGLEAQVPADDAIRAILAERIDTLHQNVGIVVGIVDANGRRFNSHGSYGAGNPRPGRTGHGDPLRCAAFGLPLLRTAPAEGGASGQSVALPAELRQLVR